jgi:hypothetical protein
MSVSDICWNDEEMTEEITGTLDKKNTKEAQIVMAEGHGLQSTRTHKCNI